ncbi:MAG: response regulator transcription factor [Clostridia bacterium]|nr:response regulator transcription factor [Clostridia bacterium]
MITIAICDDEEIHNLHTEQLIRKSLCSEILCDVEYRICVFSNSSSLIDFAKCEHIDILLLDIHMPEPDGISVAKYFHSELPDTLIIFLSNYEQYVFYSMRFSPFRFIRKSHISKELPEAMISAVLALTVKQSALDVSSGNCQQKIPISKIIYIEKIKGKNYAEIFCIDENFTCRKCISAIEKELAPHNFTKLNSSTLVNMKYIHRIDGCDVYLENGVLLRISGGRGGRLKAVKEDFLRYMRSDVI